MAVQFSGIKHVVGSSYNATHAYSEYLLAKEPSTLGVILPPKEEGAPSESFLVDREDAIDFLKQKYNIDFPSEYLNIVGDAVEKSPKYNEVQEIYKKIIGGRGPKFHQFKDKILEHFNARKAEGKDISGNPIEEFNA